MQDLAQRTGLSRQGLYLIESGKTRPKIDTLLKIIKALRGAYEGLPPPLPYPAVDAAVREFLESGWKPEELLEMERSVGGCPTDPGGGGGKKRATRWWCDACKRNHNGTAPKNCKGAITCRSDATEPTPKPSLPKSEDTCLAAEQCSPSGLNMSNANSNVARVALESLRESSETLRAKLDSSSWNADQVVAATYWLTELGIQWNRVDLPKWSHAYYENNVPGIKNDLRRIIIELIANCPTYKDKTTRGAIVQKLKRERQKHGKALARVKDADARKHDGWLRALRIVAGRLKDYDDKATVSKGAYQDRAPYDDAPKVAAIMRETESLVQTELGYVPTLETVMRKLHEVYGSLDKRERVQRIFDMMLFPRAEYSGQAWILDATGLAYEVIGAIGTKMRTGKLGQWLFLRSDRASGQTHTYWLPGKDETAGWNDALLSFLERAGYAPEFVMCDKTAALWDRLSQMQPGRDLPISAGAAAYLAAGAQPYVRTGQRPTGGSVVERNVRKQKNTMEAQNVGRVIASHHLGLKVGKYRRFGSVQTFQAFVEQAEARANGSVLQRRNNQQTPDELFAEHKESAEWRETRRLASNWQESIRDICQRMHVVRVNRGELEYRQNGKLISAKLRGDLPLTARDSVGLAMPGGMLATDDNPDVMRVLVVDQASGNAQYVLREAEADREDFFGQILRAPLFGEYKAVSQSQEDAKAKAYAEAGRKYRQSVNEVQRTREEQEKAAYEEMDVAPRIGEEDRERIA